MPNRMKLLTIDPAGTNGGSTKSINGAVPPPVVGVIPPNTSSVFWYSGGIPAGPFGVDTTIKRGPPTAVSGRVTSTVTWVSLTSLKFAVVVDGSGTGPFRVGRNTSTPVAPVNPLPSIVRVKAGSPAFARLGVIPSMVGPPPPPPKPKCVLNPMSSVLSGVGGFPASPFGVRTNTKRGPLVEEAPTVTFAVTCVPVLSTTMSVAVINASATGPVGVGWTNVNPVAPVRFSPKIWRLNVWP